MGKRKNSIVFMAGILLLCLLAGCGSDTAKKGSQDADYVIGVAPDNAPYYSKDENGKETGFYVNFMKELEESLGKKSAFSWRFEEVEPSAARQALSDGTIDGFLGDFALETGENTDRGDKNTLSQSKSFYTSKSCILAAPGTKMSRLKNLKNKNIAAKAGTQEAKTAAYFAVKYEGTENAFSSMADIFADVESGYTQAVVLDDLYYHNHDAQFTDWKEVGTKKDWKISHTLTVQKKKKLLTLFEDGIKKQKQEKSSE